MEVAEDAAEFHAQLSVALQEHSYLLAEAAFAYMRGEELQGNAARTVLQSENTPLVRDLVGNGMSQSRRDEFITGWHQWTQTVMAYAGAYRNDDAEAKTRIWRDRFNIARSMSTPLAGGMPSLDGTALRLAMEQHVEMTLAMVSNMHSKPAIDGYWGAWHTTDFIGPMGDVLAEAVVRQSPAQFEGIVLVGDGTDDAPTTRTSQAALRTDLTLLLHEHGLLIMNTTASVVDGRSTDTTAAMETLDARNSIPLARLIGSYHGTDVGEDFLDRWRQQVYAMVDFAGAVRDNDQAAQETSRDYLREMHADLAELLSDANPRLGRAAIESALNDHGDRMLETVRTQRADTAEGRYAAAMEVARETSAIVELLLEATTQQSAERVEVENTLYAMTLAWNGGDVQGFLAYWTDDAIRQRWDGTRLEVRQHLSATAGSPTASVGRVTSVSVTGAAAVAQWWGMEGIALTETRAGLVKRDGRWLIDSRERLDAPTPPGINALVPVTLQESGLLLDRTLIDGGYVAFRVQNMGFQPYEVVLYRMTSTGVAEPVATTGAIQRGQTGDLGFGLPLETGRYVLVTFLPGPESPDRWTQPLSGKSIEFTVPYVAPGS